MDKEQKMRGAPKDEVSKNPFVRKLQKTDQKPAAPDAPHNPVEEAIRKGQDDVVESAKEIHAGHDSWHDHKVVIITGGSSGIGKAAAVHLASNGYNIVLIARQKEGLHEVAQELAKYNVKILVRECDVTKVIQVHEAIQHTIKEFGRIDVLINCAGIAIYGDFETMRLEDINNQMLTNYFGTVLCIKEALPKLRESKGVIVNIASLSGLVGIPHLVAYSASKHAIVGLSESLRYELDDTGVAVTCVCPDKVKTNIFKHESFKDVAWAHDEGYGVVPSAVARTIHKAINERKLLYTVPASKKLQLLIGRLLPESVIKRRVKD